MIRFNMNCPMDWDAMEGDGARRHCGACDKHVTNISNLTPDAARSFLQRTTGDNVCVRADVNTVTGQVQFAGAAVGAAVMAAALVTASPALADGTIPNLIEDTSVVTDTDSGPDGDELPTDVTDTDCDKGTKITKPEQPIEPMMGEIMYMPPPQIQPATATTDSTSAEG